MLEIHSRIGKYEIIKLLGAGGMGEVYAARDTELDREVALKSIPAHGGADPSRRSRFLREAKAASRLNHPNIAHVYELGEHDGNLFIVMEQVPGKTLKSRLESHDPLPVADVVRLGVQLADALEEAHSQGIVHRDIKPANLMITPRGQLKLLDFGVARITETAENAVTRTATMPGTAVGTVQYMSPEQAYGKTVDHRSDLFSAGAVLYEMATGRPAFNGTSTAEVLTRIVGAEPAAIGRLTYDVPAEIERIIRKCLEKDPDNRYQSARELAIDLHNWERASATRPAIEESRVSVIRPGTSRRRLAIIAGISAAVLLAAAAAWWYLGSSRAGSSIAVLPFANVDKAEDLDYLCDGITETLINTVSRVRELTVISRAASFRFRGRENDIPNVARQLRVKTVLTGGISRRGDRLLLNTELIDGRSNTQLWGRQFTFQVSDLFSVQEAIAQEVAENLQVRLTGETRRVLSRRYSENSEAYQSYLKGRFQWNKRTQEGLAKSIPFYEDALRIDPSFSLAYVGLSDTYTMQSGIIAPREIVPKAKQAAIHALELDDTLAEGHAALAWIKFNYDWDWLDAEREYKRALELNPNYAPAHSGYSRLLSAIGRRAEAVTRMERAQELDPVALGIATGIGLAYYFDHDYDKAIQQYRKVLELEPRFTGARFDLAAALAQKGDVAAAIGEYEAAQKQAPGDAGWTCELAQLYARDKRPADARRLLDEVLAMEKKRYVSPPYIAWVYAELGNMDEAFRRLEQGYDDRSWPMVFLKVEPKYDLMRPDSRFQALVKKMAFPN